MKGVLAGINRTRWCRVQTVLADTADLRRFCCYRKIGSRCCLLRGRCCNRYWIPERIGAMCDVDGDIGIQKRGYDIVVTIALQQTQHARLAFEGTS